MWSIWRPIFGWNNLCPVVYSDLSGFLLVMRKAVQPVTFEELEQADEEYDYYPDIDVEYKPENWGRIGDEVVCLDYGIEEREAQIERRMYLEGKRGKYTNN